MKSRALRTRESPHEDGGGQDAVNIWLPTSYNTVLCKEARHVTNRGITQQPNSQQQFHCEESASTPIRRTDAMLGAAKIPIASVHTHMNTAMAHLPEGYVPPNHQVQDGALLRHVVQEAHGSGHGRVPSRSVQLHTEWDHTPTPTAVFGHHATQWRTDEHCQLILKRTTRAVEVSVAVWRDVVGVQGCCCICLWLYFLAGERHTTCVVTVYTEMYN